MARFQYILIFICSALFLRAQPFAVHLNQNIYYSGDALHYRIYPEQDLLPDSTLIYVEWYNERDSMILQQIHRFKELSVGGQFNLPNSLCEGNHSLVIYSVLDQVQGIGSKIIYSVYSIPVLNDLAEGPDPEMAMAWYASHKLNFTQVMSLPTGDSIQFNASTLYQTISSPLKEFSLSVNHYLEEDTTSNRAVLYSGLVFSPDYSFRKNIYLDGDVIDPLTNKPTDQKYISFYLPSNGKFNRVQAVHGLIKTPVGDFTNSKQFQLLDLNPNKRIPLIWNAKSSYFDINALAGLQHKIDRTPKIHYLLIQHAKRRLIRAMFDLVDKPVPPPVIRNKKFHADKTYMISEFQDIKSLEEFINEVMIDSRITSVINNKKSLRLRDYDRHDLFHWPAWYMIDGYFRGDEDVMLSFDISRIKSIDLFLRSGTINNQFDSLMRYSGIFSINTYVGEQIPKWVYTFNGLYAGPENKSTLKPNDEVPDLRMALEWKDSLNDSSLPLYFKPSHIGGKYVIQIKGVALDGNFKQASKFIEIQN